MVKVAIIILIVVITTIVTTVSRNSHSRICSDRNGRRGSDISGTHCSSTEGASAAAVAIESAKTAAVSYRIPYF